MDICIQKFYVHTSKNVFQSTLVHINIEDIENVTNFSWRKKIVCDFQRERIGCHIEDCRMSI